jgi:hypothetical protein
MMILCHFSFPKMIGALVGAIIFSVAVTVRADVSDTDTGRFGGFYKVVSSTDPSVPATDTHEYFFDFGRGIQAGKLSGSVAMSVRQNPNVQVRMLVWQYFPETGKMVIGNPYAEGSRKAVALGAWQMKGLPNGVLFERGSYQIVLHRADESD